MPLKNIRSLTKLFLQTEMPAIMTKFAKIFNRHSFLKKNTYEILPDVERSQVSSEFTDLDQTSSISNLWLLIFFFK